MRIELRVGRSLELGSALQAGQIDLAITMRHAPTPDETAVVSEPMLWLCSEKGLATRQEAVPLALLDPYCGFREAALNALDAAGRRYRIAAGSASLAGLRAAVDAGIALTLSAPTTPRCGRQGCGAHGRQDPRRPVSGRVPCPAG
ncbi:MAG: hypothetical protein EOS42_28825 [Mesorhizobium sp.]|nr:MAG: hypothetical protein EOS42_28825 [Mesorhizobium sp.]TIV26806.1 MAG: hypothetical protein E5V90_22130 [Mesorhizobium sp.]